MSKREASILGGGGIDIDAPRAKRRKEAASSSPPKEHANGTSAAASASYDAVGATGATVKEDPGEVRERGLKLWHIVKDAVNKEERVLSHDFLRLPSKRQYPDYYEIIKRPISLDEIKAQLDAEAYTSLEDVKKDFETCFRNAKRYNIKDSQIFKDAKHLHKLAVKEYNKMTGQNEDVGDPDHDGDGDHAGGSDDEAKKKKGPSMNRLLKTRLQKLIEKTADDGRVLSTEFMELPSRKLWPIYYKIIKKPQSLENIFKKLKRKEYHSSADFANDVELVFSNALEFNQEQTGIWNDAVALKGHFRQLMSDLPEPYSLPAYSAGTSQGTKLKFRVPAPSGQRATSPSTHPAVAASTTVPGAPTPSSHILTLRPPTQASTSNGTIKSPIPTAAKSPAVTPKVPPAVSPPAASTSQPSASSTPAAPSAPPAAPYTPYKTPAAPTPNTTTTTTTTTVQPASYAQPAYAAAFSQHYPNATYHKPAASSAAPASAAPAPQAASPAVPTSVPAVSQSPAPSPQKHRQPRHALLTTYPLGRRLSLDRSDGVRTWAVRLSTWESAIYVSDLKLHGQSGEEEESEEELERKEEEEEEEEGPPAPEVPEPPKKRGRGRPRKHPIESPPTPSPASAAPAQEAQAKKGKAKAARKAPLPEEPQVKMNGLVLNERDDVKGSWVVEVPFGTSVLEVGDKNGTAWRVYMERLPT